MLDLNIYSEAFFADMLNMLLWYKLKNLNVIKQNIDGIDLVDEINELLHKYLRLAQNKKSSHP